MLIFLTLGFMISAFGLAKVALPFYQQTPFTRGIGIVLTIIGACLLAYILIIQLPR